MYNVIMLIISMTACLMSGILKKHSSGLFKNKQLMCYFFNASVSLVSAISLFIMSGIGHISLFTLLLGISFGVTTALQQLFTLKAYQTGPFAYTTVITSLSTIIPTFSGYFIWGEEIALVQIFGILLMLICIILSVSGSPNTKSHSKSSAKWLVNTAIAFVCGGLIGVMQKFHQSSEYKSEIGGFLIIAFAISFAYSAISFLITASGQNLDKRQFVATELKYYMIIIMLLCGIGDALNNKINLYLSGVIDSAIFFPVVNGGNLILSAISSIIIFKEKLSMKKWTGIIIGIVAVILLCNPF